ncbi:hypothetical protein FGM00_17665 [Aggregatimonas sangjinii]|uniref:Uncharacterized protein n=1 Tax=Aggregatimonas sangjinii TaxID=2583587 RepID=A0A5B7SUK7_9FLAO|nr:heparinase II/III family protein [Aggregatimonas sangjinii]QCX01852.1 hypothetical protein FGM00_17665 [Aggregatimonas sangjinii]
MDLHKLRLLFHTLRYLRLKQIYYRIYYVVRNRFFKRAYKKTLNQREGFLKWNDSILYTDSYIGSNSFLFLNLEHRFTADIDWNYSNFGKLWTYNLNYFDFLNQQTISPEEGLRLILDYSTKDSILKDGKEPYPISLRGINWVKFLSKNMISNFEIDQLLFNHYQTLLHNLEYHLLGNHLLENGYSLLFGAYYFENKKFYTKAKQILKAELSEQILNDGAHFELSPMYHQILLFRLLDCFKLVETNQWQNDDIGQLLRNKAANMLSWLQEVTFANGSTPMVNDSAYGIAPSSQQLFDYAEQLGIVWQQGKLSDSGYRKVTKIDYELFVDIGNVGPKYQSGHAHSDTFNFEMYVLGSPVIVDTGTSTYENNSRRQQERETAAHNTVKIDGREQTQVWGAFRVAKRAKVIDIIERKDFLSATHNGYRNLGVNHTRQFTTETSKILIEDFLGKDIELGSIAYFHFHPSVENIEIFDDSLKLVDEGINIIFENSQRVALKSYDYAIGFNKRVKSKKIEVQFCNTLRTHIQL